MPDKELCLTLQQRRAAERVSAIARRHPMHLISGTRVGPYEILEATGALGMGEIESKRDPGVGRAVEQIERGWCDTD